MDGNPTGDSPMDPNADAYPQQPTHLEPDRTPHSNPNTRLPGTDSNAHTSTDIHRHTDADRHVGADRDTDPYTNGD
jgi:hypothetical protein